MDTRLLYTSVSAICTNIRDYKNDVYGWPLPENGKVSITLIERENINTI
jgi:hypothetical protein